MMDAALVCTWTTPFPGREDAALEVAAEATEFFDKLAIEGHSEKVEWYISTPAPFSFIMIRGEYDFLVGLLDDEGFLRLQIKASWALSDYGYHVYRTGDRAEQLMGWFGETIGELATA